MARLKYKLPKVRKNLSSLFGCFIVLLLLLCSCSSPVYSAEITVNEPQAKESDEVFIDADEISYDEHSGVAVAEGNVKVRNKTVRLSAPYAEYNAETNIVDAYSDHRENVVIVSGKDKFTGKHLKYNMETRRGVLTQASGKADAMYMQGGTVRIMPIDDAVKQGIVRAPKKKKQDGRSDDIAEWVGVTATTCDFTNPHYRLVSKKVIIYPGKKTVLKAPKFYIEKTLVMAYPFDYIVGRRSEALVPIIRYNSDKGAGLGIRGPIDIGNLGELDIAGIYWTQDIWEARLRYSYQLMDGLTLFASTSHLYNEDTDETLWRPFWGAQYEKNGWEARLWWSEREIVGTEDSAGATDDYDVWRKPEFSVYSPWIDDDITGGAFKFFGMWGKYRDNSRSSNGELTERFAYGASYRGKPKWSLGMFKPFYGARYTKYDYKDTDLSQEVTNAWLGFRYSIGKINLSSSYQQRWVNGRSPMRWDRYYDSKYFNQSISFPLPFGTSWEKWSLSVRGSYNLNTDRISSARYILSYNKHCITWQLWYKDDRADDDREIGLTFFINAYPEYKIELGSMNDEKKKDDF